ncbi:MAG: DUF1640 domain-containing protein [Magnetococcales bacterium]|nr:DUF1640 domain-containing protein [Magnetococcales bacterium]MBF0323307.1 DUF1640 domain-containing protein [Magnetococcales bacterium]
MTFAVAFDTLKFVRRLRDAGVDEKQAEAFSEAFREIQDAQLKELATKGDLKELELRIDSKLEEELAPIRTDLLLIKWMLALVITATVLPALKVFFPH